MYFFLFLQEAEEGWSGDQEARLRPLQVITSSFFATPSLYLTASVANPFRMVSIHSQTDLSMT